MKLQTITAALLAALSLVSCAVRVTEDEKHSETVFAMDTVMELTAYGHNAEKALAEAKAEALRLDALLTRGGSGSEIYTLNKNGSAQVSEETAALVRSALDISTATDGAFDITIAPIMDLWGFFTKDFRVPSDEELQAALASVDYKNVGVNENTVTLSGNSQLDLGGIAKGYLSRKIIDIFRENGVTSAIVSLGGNVHCLGKKTDGSLWRIAVQHPDGEGFIGTLSASDTAVITSGGYQRYFEQDGQIYHHIIDPKTGISAHSGLKSVTIITPDSTRADGLSTAVYVMGPENAADLWRGDRSFDMVLMTDDNKVYITEGIKNSFTSELELNIIE